MKLTLLLLMFISACYSQTSDDPYYYLTSSSDDTKEFYYKIEKRHELGNYITVWFKALSIPKSYKNKKGKMVHPSVEYTVSYLTIYCDDRKYNHEDYVTYNLKDEIIKSGNLRQYGIKIFPDTIMEMLCKEICD